MVFWGIGLVEVLCKTMSGIIKHRLTLVIVYCDTLHGLRAGRGTGTASLKAKLLQQLAAIREEFIYEIFIDLHQVYNELDQEICLEILTVLDSIEFVSTRIVVVSFNSCLLDLILEVR